MTEYFIATDFDRARLLLQLEEQPLPFTANIIKGDSRSLAQNRLQHMWFNEIAEFTGNSPEEVRGWCKLHIGVPIMRETEKYRKAYARTLKKLSYEQKIEAMTVFDIPVTRFMTTEQMTRYLDQVWLYFTEKVGVTLTNPDERLYKAMLATRERKAA